VVTRSSKQNGALEFAVRSLAAVDDLDRVAALLPGPRREGRGRARLLRDIAVLRPFEVLVAFEGAAVVGVLEGAATPSGYRIHAVHAPESEGRRRVVAALLSEVCERCSGRIETCAGPAEGWLRRGLEDAGFEAGAEQLHHGRDLRSCARLSGEPLRFVAYREHERRFVTGLLEQARHGGAFEPHPPRADVLLEEMLFAVSSATGLPDTSLWCTAWLGGDPVGVAFPHAGTPGPGAGTLLYVGLLPAYRGRGLGRCLHAAMLAALRRAGATAYEDATAAANTAMRRVFEVNGCSLLDASVPYVRIVPARPPAPPSGVKRMSMLREVPMRPAESPT
jgi:GNAT superfamily N-acetyltransferase